MLSVMLSLYKTIKINYFIVWILLVCWPVSGQGLESNEYQVKAAFLFNFTQFVHWPANNTGSQAIVIGVLGRDPFGSTLVSMVSGEQVNNREVRVKRYSSIEEVRDCHILFISGSEKNQISDILSHLKGKSILTVGETENFGRLGGMIHFLNENNKIRLEINNEEARMASIDISVKLLKLSTLVSTDNNLVK